ncbi:MAG: response regulator transcription factor [Chloroflexi bacterium]|nr:MAG: response regulator transcription factor [Chloroflexota bacterium]
MTRCHGNVTIGADSRIVQPILVVDDDSKIVQLVRAYLEREGYPVVTASDGRAALAAIEQHAPGLIVLDLMLPELDGMTVARRVREDSDVPILMLSARGSVADRIQGMSEGADDYLPKPFSPGELVVRVKAILRRAGGAPRRGPLRIADLDIDRDRHEVRRRETSVSLTTAEFRLLVALAEADGRVMSRDSLLDALYGHGDSETFDRTVDVYIGRLREKLGDDPERPRYVATVRGVGYRAVTPA